MSSFTSPASAHMSSPIVTVRDDARALDAEATLDRHDITALGVVDAEGTLIGVLSRSDLLAAAEGEAGSTFDVPDVAVRELMSPDPVVAESTATLAAVAARLLEERIHRVFVVEEGAPVGVLSTRDMMRAVATSSVDRPALEIATREVVTVAADASLAEAVERLDEARVHGLLVVDAGRPVGVFTQVDALLARARDPGTAVDDVMDLRVVAVPPSTPMRRAARRAVAMSVRRLALVEGDTLVGVVSSSDFCRVVAGSA